MVLDEFDAGIEYNMQNDLIGKEEIGIGDMIIAKCEGHSTRTLFGTPIAKTNITDFFGMTDKKPFFVLDDYQGIKLQI